MPGVRLHPSLLRLVNGVTTLSCCRTLSYPPLVADPVRARLWRSGGRWYARVLDAPMYVEVTGTSRIGCLDELREAIGDDVVLTVEVVPELVGVSEAADIMGWDKRRVITYIDRGHFPEPIASLAGGRIWLREEIEAYAEDWRARHPDAIAR